MRRLATLTALILATLTLLFWLDAWLLGLLAVIGVYAKQYHAGFAAHWWLEWVNHPLTSTWSILTARPPAGELGRKIWLLLHVPLVSGISYVVWLIRSNRKPSSPKQAFEYASHGSAHFDDDAALAERFASDGHGLILGRLVPPVAKSKQARPRWLIHQMTDIDRSSLSNRYMNGCLSFQLSCVPH